MAKLIVVCLLLAFASSTFASRMLNGLKRREVIVDDNGFYLGGGSNNNLREASQIWDIGGPIVNPWINSFTQPIERIGTAQRMGAFGFGGMLGVAGSPYAASQSGLGLAGFPLPGQVPPQLPVAPAAATTAVAAQTSTNALGSLNGVNLQQLAVLIAQLAQQQQQQVAPQPQPQPEPMPQPQPQPQQPKLNPFTAIFLNNGQAPLFKVGLPADINNGGYTTI